MGRVPRDAVVEMTLALMAKMPPLSDGDMSSDERISQVAARAAAIYKTIAMGVMETEKEWVERAKAKK